MQLMRFGSSVDRSNNVFAEPRAELTPWELLFVDEHLTLLSTVSVMHDRWNDRDRSFGTVDTYILLTVWLFDPGYWD